MGFSVLASVRDSSTVYPLLGRPHDSLDDSSSHYDLAFPKYLGAQYDASTTNLTYAIPASTSNSTAEIVLSFLSPITPTSTLRQSIPASYLTISVKSSFDIDLYLDINGQFVSGDRNSHIKWALEQPSQKGAAKLKTFTVKRSHEELFTEKGDQAEWGTLHFTGPADTAHEAGTSGRLRQRFAKMGTLNNIV